jgi:hypothetical protein
LVFVERYTGFDRLNNTTGTESCGGARAAGTREAPAVRHRLQQVVASIEPERLRERSA